MIDFRRNDGAPLGAQCYGGGSTKGAVLGSVGQIFLGPLAGALAATVSKKDRASTAMYGLGPAGALGLMYQKKQTQDPGPSKSAEAASQARQRAYTSNVNAPRPSGG